MTSRRVTLIAGELLGYVRAGGVGTSTTFLALAMARAGHSVEVLYIGDRGAALDDGWAELYRAGRVGVRTLPPLREPVAPAPLARGRAVELALREDPPDVVIAHEFGAPAYTAQRLRQLGLDFQHTLFVVLCHGTRRWVKEVTRNPEVAPEVLGEAILEQVSAELADVVVSPSAYLVDWMRRRGWRLPDDTRVIPHPTRSAATGDPPPRHEVPGGRVQRLAFFGRLEARKGLEPFATAVNALGPELLTGVELEFLGKPTKHWSAERVESLLSERTRATLRSVSFETGLDQHEALERLRRPGTLAVIPSLGENSPNTVYECLEQGIPFLASEVGGIPELVAPSDHARVLFEPTAAGVEAALGRALRGENALRPAQPAFDGAAAIDAWSAVVETHARAVPVASEQPEVDAVVVDRGSQDTLARCLAALERQSYRRLRPITAGSRLEGLRRTRADWVVLHDGEDVPEPELVETLVRAQAACGADVVTCGQRVRRGADETLQLFTGEPAGLGVLENGYGTVALIRRSLLAEESAGRPAAADPDWPLFAQLTAAGARLVSVPAPLVTRPAAPGTLRDQPSDALLVVERLEWALPDSLRSLARLAAGLAADLQPSADGTNGRGEGRPETRVALARRRLQRLLRSGP